MITVLIVDDQALFREGLRTLLSVNKEIEVVGEAANGEEAIRLVEKWKPAVVLMDIQMPQLDGVTATRRLKATHPECRVIVLTTFDDDEKVFEGLRAGALGYLLKDAPSEKLVEAIKAAARGESFLQPSVAAKLVAEFARLSDRPAAKSQGLEEPLSEREIEVLRRIAAGASNKEVANALVIAEGTVKNHVTNILGKLGVTGRLQAVNKARELGII
jgi:DNA-binding NarL/FixJ family response regulator